MTTPSMTTGALMQALRDHYIPPSRAGQPGGVLATEVAVNGSYGAGRRCDALWAGFTSSSGRILVGHELKVSRSDWRAELDKANKADTWADACHAWYVVAPSTAIVPPEEIPRWLGAHDPSHIQPRQAHACRCQTPGEDRPRATMVGRALSDGPARHPGPAGAPAGGPGAR